MLDFRLFKVATLFLDERFRHPWHCYYYVFYWKCYYCTHCVQSFWLSTRWCEREKWCTKKGCKIKCKAFGCGQVLRFGTFCASMSVIGKSSHITDLNFTWKSLIEKLWIILFQHFNFWNLSAGYRVEPFSLFFPSRNMFPANLVQATFQQVSSMTLSYCI